MDDCGELVFVMFNLATTEEERDLSIDSHTRRQCIQFAKSVGQNCHRDLITLGGSGVSQTVCTKARCLWTAMDLGSHLVSFPGMCWMMATPVKVMQSATHASPALRSSRAAAACC